MAAPKVRTQDLSKLFEQDKKTVEELRKRLCEKLVKDPGAARKAALILESWLSEKPKRR